MEQLLLGLLLPPQNGAGSPTRYVFKKVDTPATAPLYTQSYLFSIRIYESWLRSSRANQDTLMEDDQTQCDSMAPVKILYFNKSSSKSTYPI